MQRRDFIKNTCKICFSGLAISSILSACTSLPLVSSSETDGKLSVSVDKFLTNAAVLVRTPKLPFDILVRKLSENNYSALYLKCTHEDQPLVATGKAIYCSSHGSAFDLEGKVTKEPATFSLHRFTTKLENNSVFINLK